MSCVHLEHTGNRGVFKLEYAPPFSDGVDSSHAVIVQQVLQASYPSRRLLLAVA